MSETPNSTHIRVFEDDAEQFDAMMKNHPMRPTSRQQFFHWVIDELSRRSFPAASTPAQSQHEAATD